jgi:hypothetical protein
MTYIADALPFYSLLEKVVCAETLWFSRAVASSSV